MFLVLDAMEVKDLKACRNVSAVCYQKGWWCLWSLRYGENGGVSASDLMCFFLSISFLYVHCFVAARPAQFNVIYLDEVTAKQLKDIPICAQKYHSNWSKTKKAHYKHNQQKEQVNALWHTNNKGRETHPHALQTKLLCVNYILFMCSFAIKCWRQKMSSMNRK